jgi:hypothetical protein
MISRLFFGNWLNQLQKNYCALPYSVAPHPHIGKQIYNFFELRAKGELKDRIIPMPGHKDRALVDNVFAVIYPPETLKQRALRRWGGLHAACQVAMTAAGVVALVGVALAMRGGMYGLLVVAGMIITIASCIFAGNILAAYLPASESLAVLKNPAEDFLARRDADLQRPFPEILKNKCRFATHPRWGTLTDLEMLFLWRHHFNCFVTKALKPNPQSDKERLAWLAEIGQHNPLSCCFFALEPSLLHAKGWEAVRYFQQRMDSAYAATFSYEEIRELLEEAKQILVEGKSPSRLRLKEK